MRRRVYPADPTLIFGYEQHDLPGFGQQHNWIDGIVRMATARAMRAAHRETRAISLAV
jgi:hypothetical protein